MTVRRATLHKKAAQESVYSRGEIFRLFILNRNTSLRNLD
jgi:hypothetical protein